MANIEIEYLGSLKGHNGIVTSIVVGKDSEGNPLVVSGARDKKLIIWNLNLDRPVEIEINETTKDKLVGKPRKALSGHNHFVSSLSISKDSNFVLSGSWDKTIRLWNLNTFKTEKIFNGHTKDVLSVAFSNDGRLIYTGSMDNTFKYWNSKGENKHTETFNGWVSCILNIKRSNKNNLIAVGSWDQTIKLYDAKELSYVSTIDGFDYGVVSTCTDDEGDFIFAAEKNGKIRVLKIADDNTSELKSTIDVNADLNAISFEHKHYTAIACATSKGLSINEVNKTNTSIYSRQDCACHSLAWDETKTYLFAGYADGVIRVFKFKSEGN